MKVTPTTKQRADGHVPSSEIGAALIATTRRPRKTARTLHKALSRPRRY